MAAAQPTTQQVAMGIVRSSTDRTIKAIARAMADPRSRFSAGSRAKQSHSGARLIYAQHRWINPTGARMRDGRPSRVLELIRSSGAFLIEDDAARDLDLSPAPFVPLVFDDADGHVIYLRSLTKGVAPALRVVALIARGPALTRLRGAQSVQGAFVSTLLQQIACDALTAPGWPRHLRHVRGELTQPRDALGRCNSLPPPEVDRPPRPDLWSAALGVPPRRRASRTASCEPPKPSATR